MRRSDLIHDSDKKKRFTEAYIVRMTTCLIRALEKENKRLGVGMKVPNGLLKQKRLKKKANHFLKFSTFIRPTLIQVLKRAQSHVSKACRCIDSVYTLRNMVKCIYIHIAMFTLVIIVCWYIYMHVAQ